MIPIQKKKSGSRLALNNLRLILSKKFILPIIVIAQFCCTSLWFAGNAILSDLIVNFSLSSSDLGNLISAVQFGFILGTLSFAVLTITDRFSPSKVFFVSAILGTLTNLGIVVESNTLISILTLRFLTGFFLAGIYPVGMKIAADYYKSGLGKALGLLVGALVLGTAFPHLLKDFSSNIGWKNIIYFISLMASIGGVLILSLVPDGSYRTASQKIELKAFLKIFENKNFKSAAFGYFGHMWELYAFWTFVPVMIESYKFTNNTSNLNTSLLSFIIIGVGSIACIVSGFLSLKIGTKKVAFSALLLSAICCVLSPFFLSQNNDIAFIGFLIFWGIVVIADSPLFSTLVAKNATPEFKGTALTIVNCIGFAITIISIQLLNYLTNLQTTERIFIVLVVGPIFGLSALIRHKKSSIIGA